MNAALFLKDDDVREAVEAPISHTLLAQIA